MSVGGLARVCAFVCAFVSGVRVLVRACGSCPTLTFESLLPPGDAIWECAVGVVRTALGI